MDFGSLKHLAPLGHGCRGKSWQLTPGGRIAEYEVQDGPVAASLLGPAGPAVVLRVRTIPAVGCEAVSPGGDWMLGDGGRPGSEGAWQEVDRYPPWRATLDFIYEEERAEVLGGMATERVQDIEEHLLATVREVLGALRDAASYRWTEIRDALLRSAAASHRWARDPREAEGFCLGLEPLLEFISSVLQAKWVLGIGACANDPDPCDLWYPRGGLEWLAQFDWLPVRDYLEDCVRLELGLPIGRWPLDLPRLYVEVVKPQAQGLLERLFPDKAPGELAGPLERLSVEEFLRLSGRPLEAMYGEALGELAAGVCPAGGGKPALFGGACEEWPRWSEDYLRGAGVALTACPPAVTALLRGAQLWGFYAFHRIELPGREEVQAEMDRRGLTLERFFRAARHHYGPSQAFRSLEEILEWRYGPDWDCVVRGSPAAVRGLVQQGNSAWVTEDGAFWQGRYRAEVWLGNAFVEKYGPFGLAGDLRAQAADLYEGAHVLLSVFGPGEGRYEGVVFEKFVRMERTLRGWVLRKLKRVHPEREDWWYLGVPEPVRIDCAKRREEERGRDESLEYCDFVDLERIFTSGDNWKHFGLALEAISGDKGKRDATQFLRELNPVRRRLMHSRPLSRDEEQSILRWADAVERTLEED